MSLLRLVTNFVCNQAIFNSDETGCNPATSLNQGTILDKVVISRAGAYSPEWSVQFVMPADLDCDSGELHYELAFEDRAGCVHVHAQPKILL